MRRADRRLSPRPAAPASTRARRPDATTASASPGAPALRPLPAPPAGPGQPAAAPGTERQGRAAPAGSANAPRLRPLAVGIKRHSRPPSGRRHSPFPLTWHFLPASLRCTNSSVGRRPDSPAVVAARWGDAPGGGLQKAEGRGTPRQSGGKELSGFVYLVGVRVRDPSLGSAVSASIRACAIRMWRIGERRS